MPFFGQLGIGFIMIGLTVMIHAVGMDMIIRRIAYYERELKRMFGRVAWKPMLAGGVVMGVFFLHVISIWLWAGLYELLGSQALSHFDEALYFSMITYSTVGYGDIVLEPALRILSGVEAANGLILFGWSTAFIFEVITQIYRREAMRF